MNLYEDTYNTLKYAKLAKTIYSKLFILGNDHVDITENFQHLPIYWKVLVVPTNSKEHRGRTYYNNMTKDIVIEIKNTGMNDAVRTLRHELVHALDFEKMLQSNGSIPNQVHKTKTLLAYKMDSMEMNDLIHAAKYYKDKNEKKFNKIESYEDFMKEMIINKDKLFFSHFSESDFKHLIKDETLKTKIIKRLNRENLLPKEIK